MARTGKKSTKSKPSLMKKQITQNRKIKKTSNAKDKAIQDALDKQLTSEDILLKKSSRAKKDNASEKEDEDKLLASFDQLRGM